MTESEAIEIVRKEKSYMDSHAGRAQSESFQMAINALEKQMPKKPILKHDVSVMHINRGNQPHEWKRLESDNWHCPECDSFVGERVYVLSKIHDQRKKKYCDNCGQKIDFGE